VVLLVFVVVLIAGFEQCFSVYGADGGLGVCFQVSVGTFESDRLFGLGRLGLGSRVVFSG
jgi:hypothetical protein